MENEFDTLNDFIKILYFMAMMYVLCKMADDLDLAKLKN